MKRIALVVIGAFAYLLIPALADAQAATGSIYGEIRVEGDIPRADSGEGLDGSVFWLTIIPKEIEVDISVETAQEYSVRAEDGFFRKDGLAPGTYVVAFVFDESLAAEPLPRTLEVSNLGGVTTSWPAQEVEVRAGEAVAVDFTRVAYPPLPEGFVFPHAHGDHEKWGAQHSSHSGEVHVTGTAIPYRVAGFGLLLVGFLLVGILAKSRTDQRKGYRALVKP